MTHTLYLVLGPGRWYKSVRIVRTTKKEPTLKAREVAIKLEVDLPPEILEAPIVPVQIRKENIIRPLPKVAQN